MSRVNFGAKPNMYPLPVLIIATYDKDGNPDAMNAAWGVVTDFNEISISMGDHKTTDNLAATGAFTVSMATEDTVVGCDYVGIESGRKVPDKFARAGFHATKSEFVNAPLIDELPMALECKVKSFDNGILVGEIVNVCADESVLTDGKIDPKKLKPIAFDPVNNTYLAAAHTDRAAASRAILQTISDTAPIVPVCFEKHCLYVHRGAVGGLSPTKYNIFNRITEWKINNA